MDGNGLKNPIFDIAPSLPRATVNIAGKNYELVGVPFRIVMAVTKDAPAILGYFFGGKLDLASMENSPEAVATIIAAGFGAPDDESVKREALNLPLDIQLELFAAILLQSTGGGAVPFAAKLVALRNAINPPTKSEPIPLRFKIVEPETLPESSSSSSPDPDLDMKQFGT